MEEEGRPAGPPAKPGSGAVDSATNELRQPPSSRVRRAEEKHHSRERGTHEQPIGLRLAADASVLAVRDGENGVRGETTTGGDQISREVGVETRDTLSSLSTDESPDWVRLADPIRNGSGPAEGGGAQQGGVAQAGRGTWTTG